MSIISQYIFRGSVYRSSFITGVIFTCQMSKIYSLKSAICRNRRLFEISHLFGKSFISSKTYKACNKIKSRHESHDFKAPMINYTHIKAATELMDLFKKSLFSYYKNRVLKFPDQEQPLWLLTFWKFLWRIWTHNLRLVALTYTH